MATNPPPTMPYSSTSSSSQLEWLLAHTAGSELGVASLPDDLARSYVQYLAGLVQATCNPEQDLLDGWTLHGNVLRWRQHAYHYINGLSYASEHMMLLVLPDGDSYTIELSSEVLHGVVKCSIPKELTAPFFHALDATGLAAHLSSQVKRIPHWQHHPTAESATWSMQDAIMQSNLPDAWMTTLTNPQSRSHLATLATHQATHSREAWRLVPEGILLATQTDAESRMQYSVRITKTTEPAHYRIYALIDGDGNSNLPLHETHPHAACRAPLIDASVATYHAQELAGFFATADASGLSDRLYENQQRISTQAAKKIRKLLTVSNS